MQWKTDPLDMDLVLLLQFVNTPGNEIAPRSDIVREDLQDHRFCHNSLQYCSKPLARSPASAGSLENSETSLNSVSDTRAQHLILSALGRIVKENESAAQPSSPSICSTSGRSNFSRSCRPVQYSPIRLPIINAAVPPITVLMSPEFTQRMCNCRSSNRALGTTFIPKP